MSVVSKAKVGSNEGKGGVEVPEVDERWANLSSRESS